MTDSAAAARFLHSGAVVKWTRRLDRFASWWWDVALVAVFVLVTVLVARGVTADLDLGVRDWVQTHQPTWAHWLAWLLNYLGQGWLVTWILTGGLTVLLLVRSRSWRALLPWASGFLLTYVTLGPLKIWTHRDAPSSALPNAVEMFNPLAVAYSNSYPSGHVVNAIVWWGLIVILASRMWRLPPVLVRWLRVAPPVIVLLTTTYLSYHWITDGIAALALGLLLDRLIHRVDWDAVLPDLRKADRAPLLYTER
ncbi:phosphatase PAP2 family protein [Catellatospora sp. KI3]|uniref:phosphatase PAP2 family protein n=1 Tax=Catellatospora sp. KI3 TaxID=3041620 RepID=UPI0024825CFE|nr:phosphatase PAP2 family protein [Catellatospora sp. KI3]MDI1465832.1 phosphatase PAP2 family protein [Catellatospora sp. KI3]